MHYVINKEQFHKLREGWKKEKSHSASEMIAYNILRGFEPKRGFTPKTNPKKLANGLTEWGSFLDALSKLLNSLSVPEPKKWRSEEDNQRLMKQYLDLFKKWNIEYDECLYMRIRNALQEDNKVK
jgi:hypothetical protein